MPRAVFVERKLTARRGRRTATVRLRIYKPTPDRGHWNCAFDIFADTEKLWTPRHLSGIDGLQALLMVIGFAVFTLETFERDTGMKLEDWAWIDVWKLRPRIGSIGDTKRRAALVRRMDDQLKKNLQRDTKRTGRPKRARKRT